MSTSLPLVIAVGVFILWGMGNDLNGLPLYPKALNTLKEDPYHIFECNDPSYVSLKENMENPLLKLLHSIFYKDVDISRLPRCGNTVDIEIDEGEQVDFKTYGLFSVEDFTRFHNGHLSEDYLQGTGYSNVYANMDPNILNNTSRFYIKEYSNQILLLLIVDKQGDFIPYEVKLLNELSNMQFVLSFTNLKTNIIFRSDIVNWIYYFLELFYTYLYVTIDDYVMYLINFTRFNSIVCTVENDTIYVLEEMDRVVKTQFDRLSFSPNAITHLLDIHKQKANEIVIGELSTVISANFNTYTPGSYTCKINCVPETHKHHVEIDDPGNVEQFGILSVQVGNVVDIYIISIYRLLLFPDRTPYITYDEMDLTGDDTTQTLNWWKVNDENDARDSCSVDSTCVGFQLMKRSFRPRPLLCGGSDCLLYRPLTNDSMGTAIQKQNSQLQYKNWRNPDQEYSIAYTITRVATNETEHIESDQNGTLNKLNIISFGDHIDFKVHDLLNQIQSIPNNNDISIGYTVYGASSDNMEIYVYCQVRNENDAKRKVHPFMKPHFIGYHHYFHKITMELNHITVNVPGHSNSTLKYYKVRVENLIDGIEEVENIPCYSTSPSSSPWKPGGGLYQEGMCGEDVQLHQLLTKFVYSKDYLSMAELIELNSALSTYLNDTYTMDVGECPIHQKLAANGKSCENLTCKLTIYDNNGEQADYSTIDGTLTQTLEEAYDKWGSDDNITKFMTLSGDFGCRVEGFDNKPFGAGTTLGTYILDHDNEVGEGNEKTYKMNLDNFVGKISSFGINSEPPFITDQTEEYTEPIEYFESTTTNKPFTGNPKRTRETTIPDSCSERSLSQCLETPDCKFQGKPRNRKTNRGTRTCVNA